ncbi:hypothetical protein H8K35_02270 [Undibacterium sp. LX40W]|uniref:Uncharacterized protein n=1 Tax=Undibacterium nitidum TaxID=2762298 RepID=A0A923HTB2_9BURK|nr:MULTISPECIES: FimV/HubP family polar landmark protein [Undibacterium]MBC3880794.1 hypothetical protein [Undibacterium nitidum]MBC3890473.1 hypothetical protein [Undibacterium sp. LX40W]
MKRSSTFLNSIRKTFLVIALGASLSSSGFASGGATAGNPHQDIDLQTRNKEAYDSGNSFEKSNFDEKTTGQQIATNSSSAEAELKANQAQLREALQKQMNTLLLENAEINRKRIELLESDKKRVFWTQSLVVFLIASMLVAVFAFWRMHATAMINRSISALSNTLSNFQDSFFNFVDTTQLAANSQVSSFQLQAEIGDADEALDFDLDLSPTKKRSSYVNKTTNISSDYFVEELDSDEHFKTQATIEQLPEAVEPVAELDAPAPTKSPDEFFAVKGYVDSWLRVYKPSDAAIETAPTDLAAIEKIPESEVAAVNALTATEKLPDTPAIAAQKALAAQPASPRGLLAKLDSCRANNDAEGYEQVYREIKKLFNLKLEPWEMLGAVEQKQLSDFPHIINKILELWASDDITVYLERLLSNSRINPREGFDLPIYQKLEDLLELARENDRPRDLQLLKKIDRAGFLFVPLPVNKVVSPNEKRKSSASDSVSAAEPALKIEKELSYTNNENKARKLEAMITPEFGALDPISDVESKDLIVPDLPAPSESSLSIVAKSTEEKFLLSPFEVRIKLAVAYTEMGDSEGAILLLEEVIHDAPLGQRKHAERLLKEIQDKKARLQDTHSNTIIHT